jgi:hypothetical protein
MNDACVYITTDYQNKSVEYFSKDFNDNHYDLKFVIHKLQSTLSSNFEITQTYIDNFHINIKFIFNGRIGWFYDKFDSRGYDYWVVDFMNV